ncbi:MAG: hypothetical protein IJL47_07100, partial [Lachnospiraceae bacterium]|nr:hypothetical protein [Lachnospiraceae bacterium]
MCGIKSSAFRLYQPKLSCTNLAQVNEHRQTSLLLLDIRTRVRFKSLLLRSRKPVELPTGFTFEMGFHEGESGFESMLRMPIFLSPLCGPRKQRSQSSLNPSFSAQKTRGIVHGFFVIYGFFDRRVGL